MSLLHEDVAAFDGGGLLFLIVETVGVGLEGGRALSVARPHNDVSTMPDGARKWKQGHRTIESSTRRDPLEEGRRPSAKRAASAGPRIMIMVVVVVVVVAVVAHTTKAKPFLQSIANALLV
jgi:hypothetical protein